MKRNPGVLPCNEKIKEITRQRVTLEQGGAVGCCCWGKRFNLQRNWRTQHCLMAPLPPPLLLLQQSPKAFTVLRLLQYYRMFTLPLLLRNAVFLQCNVSAGILLLYAYGIRTMYIAQIF